MWRRSTAEPTARLPLSAALRPRENARRPSPRLGAVAVFAAGALVLAAALIPPRQPATTLPSDRLVPVAPVADADADPDAEPGGADLTKLARELSSALDAADSADAPAKPARKTHKRSPGATKPRRRAPRQRTTPRQVVPPAPVRRPAPAPPAPPRAPTPPRPPRGPASEFGL